MFVLSTTGGTVDITVHQIAQKGCLREFYRANGGAWGGTQVDKKFLSFMDDIVGKSFMACSDLFRYIQEMYCNTLNSEESITGT